MNTSYDPITFKAGEMDTESQQATFDGFVKVLVTTTIILAVVLIFLLIVAT